MKQPPLLRLRWYVIAAAVILTATLVYLSASFIGQVGEVVATVDGRLWLLIGLAVAVQLVGHVLRTLRTKTVLDSISKGSLANQFGALSIGYLFNVLLPFRAGELVRALIIALRLRVSLLFTFVVILLERIIDLLFIGFLVIIAALFFSGSTARLLVVGALGAIAISVLVIAGLVLLIREDQRLLSVIWRVTSWFNPGLCNKMRFKVWSLIYGLQRFRDRRLAVRRYIMLTIASWTCYIVSMLVLVLALIPGLNGAQQFIAASSPYIAVTSPAGPSYPEVYSQVISPVVAVNQAAPSVEDRFIVLSWLLLIVPMSLIGIASLFFVKVRVTRRRDRTSEVGFANKLQRIEDISQEFPGFLDSYFSGHSLARVLHKLETSGELSLVRYFKGGSDAITILVLSDSLIVKKIIPLEYEDRLKAQYDWLHDHRKLKNLVKTLGEQRTDDYYAIDLQYDSENISLFEYVHSTSHQHAKEAVETVWKALADHLYDAKKLKKLAVHTKERDAFVKKHIEGCIALAAEANPALKQALEPDTLIINGQEYDNFHVIMDKIRHHPQAWRDIATYRQAPAVHGDMAIDNILISPRTRTPLIIDPAPDGNIIEGPVFDMGKLSQSFFCGYEFLFRSNDPVDLLDGNHINYRDHRSAAYTQLWEYLRNDLAPRYLSPEEQRSLMFHAATLHLRVLKHRVYINPDTVLQFYATGIRTLNLFLAQYDEPETSKRA